MPRTIRITAGNVTMDATLNETATASEIWDALPNHRLPIERKAEA